MFNRGEVLKNEGRKIERFFSDMRQSLTNFGFYRQVAFRPVTENLKYLLWLILIITIVLSIRYGKDLSYALDKGAKWAKDNLPPITIENGKASTPVEQPFLIEEEDFVFIIDTAGTTTSIDPTYKQGILIMEDRLIYKTGEVETREYDFSEIKSFTFSPEVIERWKRIGIWILLPLMAVALFIYHSIAKLLQILLFGLISVATNKIIDVRLDYRNLFNIGVYALTPAVLLGLIVNIIGTRLPFFWVIYSIVYVVFLILAVKGCKENARTPFDVQSTPDEQGDLR